MARPGASSKKGLYVFVGALVLMVSLMMVDAVMTNVLITMGVVHEGNPLLKGLAGKDVFVFVKLVGALVCAAMLANIYRRCRTMAIVGGVGAALIYVLIVAWNLSVIIT